MKIKLYVTDRGQFHEERVREVCSLIKNCDLEVISIVDDPQSAEWDGIVATPTLFRDNPPRRVVGEFRNPRAVAEYLSLPEW